MAQPKAGNVIRKIAIAFLLVGSIVFLDISTKRWATAALFEQVTIPGIGGMPLTLAFNQGVAFGLALPDAGRWMIIIATIVVLIVLSNMYVRAAPDDWSRLLSLQLVSAGAIGNLIDRVRWDTGVVDFIGPFDIGSVQFPIFNIADIAITSGAVMLAISLLREDAAASDVVEGEAALVEEPVLNADGTVS